MAVAANVRATAHKVVKTHVKVGVEVPARKPAKIHAVFLVRILLADDI